MGVTKPIHTLNARNHLMLEVIRDYFGLNPARMHSLIQSMRTEIEEVLSNKGVDYQKLKSALVPNRKRKEIALVFDTNLIESTWYGYEVFEQLIPLLDKRGNHSILTGDYPEGSGHLEKFLTAFEEEVKLRRSVEFGLPNQFYIVYLNNLTDSMIRSLTDGLNKYAPYVGYADTTFGSKFKLYLSARLSNLCVKHGSIIIQGHEPGLENSEDLNMCGYPFEESGYDCKSINCDLMGALLSYKIERQVIAGFEADTEFALNAISTSPSSFENFEIEVEDAKLKYIKSNKADSLARADLASISASELAGLIRSKISDSYIYNLRFLEEHNVAKFNIIIELESQTGGTTRLLAAFSYEPEKRVLRLITLY